MNCLIPKHNTQNNEGAPIPFLTVPLAIFEGYRGFMSWLKGISSHMVVACGFHTPFPQTIKTLEMLCNVSSLLGLFNPMTVDQIFMSSSVFYVLPCFDASSIMKVAVFTLPVLFIGGCRFFLAEAVQLFLK